MNDDIKSAHGLSVLAIGKIARLATLMKHACIEYFIRKWNLYFYLKNFSIKKNQYEHKNVSCNIELKVFFSIYEKTMVFKVDGCSLTMRTTDKAVWKLIIISSSIQDEVRLLFLSRSDSGVVRGAPVYGFCFALSFLLEHFRLTDLTLLRKRFFGFLCALHSSITEIHSNPQITGNTQKHPPMVAATPTPTKEKKGNTFKRKSKVAHFLTTSYVLYKCPDLSISPSKF